MSFPGKGNQRKDDIIVSFCNQNRFHLVKNCTSCYHKEVLKQLNYRSFDGANGSYSNFFKKIVKVFKMWHRHFSEVPSCNLQYFVIDFSISCGFFSGSFKLAKLNPILENSKKTGPLN